MTLTCQINVKEEFETLIREICNKYISDEKLKEYTISNLLYDLEAYQDNINSYEEFKTNARQIKDRLRDLFQKENTAIE